MSSVNCASAICGECHVLERCCLRQPPQAVMERIAICKSSSFSIRSLRARCALTVLLTVVSPRFHGEEGVVTGRLHNAGRCLGALSTELTQALHSSTGSWREIQSARNFGATR